MLCFSVLYQLNKYEFLIYNIGEINQMKFTLIVVALFALNLAACGKNEEPAKVSAIVVQGGYNATLAEGVQFVAKPNYPSFIKSVTGMSGYEPIGRWSDGNEVIFTFTQNLPGTFTLDLDLADAFGPNVGKVVQIQVGNWKQQFVADAKPSNNKFLVKTSLPTDSIEFTIPEPKSPKDLGMSGDSRQLGILFKRLSITTN
jgi:hypothetical protein